MSCFRLSPRVLGTILALLLVATATYVVVSSNETPEQLTVLSTPTVLPPHRGGITAIPVPSTEAPPSVTQEEIDRAIASLETSPTFAALTQETGWFISVQVPNLNDDGKKVGIGLFLELDEKVDSHGPWLSLHCRGAVSTEFDYGYRGIKVIGATFAPTGELIQLKPLGFDEVAPDSTVVPAPDCPPGLEDREN